MNRLKIAGYLLAALALVGVGYKLAPVQPAKEMIVYQDKVVVKDRVVTKDVVRTETRPDGTKIVTTENEHSTEHTTDTDKSKTVVVSTAAQTRYSLGVGIILDPFNPLNRDYQIELGKRLWSTPLWGTFAVNTNKTIVLGIKYEF